MKWRFPAGLVLTAAYAFLLYQFTRRYPPVPVFLLQILIILGTIVLVRRRMIGQAWWWCALLGAGIGYAAALLASAAMMLGYFGAAEFPARFFQLSSLYVYPLVSLGWLYGAAIAVLWFWWPQGSMRRA